MSMKFEEDYYCKVMRYVSLRQKYINELSQNNRNEFLVGFLWEHQFPPESWKYLNIYQIEKKFEDLHELNGNLPDWFDGE